MSGISISKFIHQEFKHFSNADNIRSIPSIVDGFKDAQRKAIHGMTIFGKSEEKVSRLSSKIAVETNYHHGETSLAGTLVGLAQSFPGANNLNLLEPLGQFGSRLSAEASSERYISTMKSKWFDIVLSEQDRILLKHKIDEGIEIEPENFFPSIPLWLVNGATGIGTGYSVSVYARNPRDVAKLMIMMIKQETVSDAIRDQLLCPWFRGWKGSVVQREFGKYEFRGVLEIVNTTTIKITELPIGVGVDKYKQHLIDLMNKQVIKDFDNNSSEDGFEFIISVPREFTKQPVDKLMQTFNLVSKGSDVVTMWDTENKIHPYQDVFIALREFVNLRKTKYAQWKALRLQQYQDNIKRLQIKADFISAWHSMPGVGKMRSDDVLREISNSIGCAETEIQEFMNIPVRSLALDKVNELHEEITKEIQRHDDLEQTAVNTLFINALGPIIKSKDFS